MHSDLSELHRQLCHVCAYLCGCWALATVKCLKSRRFCTGCFGVLLTTSNVLSRQICSSARKEDWASPGHRGDSIIQLILTYWHHHGMLLYQLCSTSQRAGRSNVEAQQGGHMKSLCQLGSVTRIQGTSTKATISINIINHQCHEWHGNKHRSPSKLQMQAGCGAEPRG